METLEGRGTGSKKFKGKRSILVKLGKKAMESGRYWGHKRVNPKGV